MSGSDKISYRVRYSERARRCRVQVTPEGVVLVVPHAMPLERAKIFLISQLDWIQRHLTRQAEVADELPPGTLLYHGVPTPLRLMETAITRPRALRDEYGFTVFHPTGNREAVASTVERLLRTEAVTTLSREVSIEAKRTGLSPASLSIRNQRSRWGSCAHHGHISLNWRLLMATPEARRYVIIHELAHLEEANHGPRFWVLVERWFPAWRRERAWLRRYGTLLHRPVAACLP